MKIGNELQKDLLFVHSTQIDNDSKTVQIDFERRICLFLCFRERIDFGIIYSQILAVDKDNIGEVLSSGAPLQQYFLMR